jgi:hypothetical protein
MAEPIEPAIALAERVVQVAHELGIATALIGAAALAVHNYVRATEDIDLAANVDPSQLRTLQQRLDAQQMYTELRLPDAEDDLGGVLEIWQHADEDGDPIDSIEIVNFANPFRPGRDTPAADAVRNARELGGASKMRCVQLPDLIALKLYARSRRDEADVIELLRRNPDADIDAVRAVCKRFGFEDTLEELIAESRG